MKETRKSPSAKDDVERYRENYLSEQEGAYLYRMLAGIERDAHLAELYRRIAAIEQRHADLWKGYLEAAGEPLPTYAPNWRIHALLWIATRLGTGAVLSTVSSILGLAVYAWTTKRDFSRLGDYLFFGLILLLVASLAGLFFYILDLLTVLGGRRRRG